MKKIYYLDNLIDEKEYESLFKIPIKIVVENEMIFFLKFELTKVKGIFSVRMPDKGTWIFDL